MADIFLRTYKVGESATGFNAPHKYRFAVKKNLQTTPYLDAWKRDLNKVLKELIERIGVKFKADSIFAFAVAPSRTGIFVEDIRQHLIASFPNAVDLSSCFSKRNGFDAGTTTQLLTDSELRERFALDGQCYASKMNNEIHEILLVDDVFSLGNTLRGMSVIIHDIANDKQITTAVIIKT